MGNELGVDCWQNHFKLPDSPPPEGGEGTSQPTLCGQFVVIRDFDVPMTGLGVQEFPALSEGRLGLPKPTTENGLQLVGNLTLQNVPSVYLPLFGYTWLTGSLLDYDVLHLNLLVQLVISTMTWVQLN